MRAIDVTCTDLFIGTVQQPAQVLRVTIEDLQGQAQITVAGPGVSGSVRTSTAVTELGLQIDAPVGAVLEVSIHASDDAGDLTASAALTVAEPGWTMYLISHFHYDPVWWATQAAYAVTWNDSDELAQRFRMHWQQPGFALIDTHLDLARRDADYKFVLAEVDLLKPYWDARPGQRNYLRQLVSEGRLELLGGTYNEPNTNLTSAEVTIRNFIYGAGFQREVFGADPATAWQLDAFGHDPQFPGLAADAGVSSSSWARGPFRPWGPMLTAFLPGAQGWGDPTSMQFASEFEWISPSGKGLLTHYMPAHYSAGWVMDEANTLDEAEAALYELFSALKKVAATRNVLLPVGTDYTPPNKWVTDVHRHWNARYVWPRFQCAVPAEFFAAVRAELDTEQRQLSPQSRDMNPIFTGKEVSYIDTKQAHRAAEIALVDSEKFAVFARSLGAAYPHAALDKAWRHLVYGAHHDAVTGSESDQVYLDLLTNWHESLDLADQVMEDSLNYLCGLVQGAEQEWSVTVFNASSWLRSDGAEICAEFPAGALNGFEVVDDSDTSVPALIQVLARHPDASLASVRITLIAKTVPSLGYRTWRLMPAAPTGQADWQPLELSEVRQAGEGGEGGEADTISSSRFLLTVDPNRGGCVSRLYDRRHDRELIAPGSVANALLRSHEYAEHPSFNEGPWHLLPTGQTLSSATAPASSVQVQTSALGQRILIEGRLDGVTYQQRLTLWDGIDRVDCHTELHGFDGADQLFRVQWPAAIAGAMPVSEVGNAVIGRGHALIDVDSADHPWTLDNPAYGFCALSSTARVRINGSEADPIERAINTAEIITSGTDCRELAVALVRCGVTATTSTAAGPRYGNLAVDSNLPDVRISLGLPEENAFTAAVLAGAAEHAAEFKRQYADTGSARIWVPAMSSLSQVWQPSADLRDIRCLPVLLIAGADAPAQLSEDLTDFAIEVNQQATAADGGPDLEDFSFGLINRGTPGFAIDTKGALHISLMRSCTGWPSGVWIDPPSRSTPDGSNFQQQHWSHAFDYAVAAGAGDWRQADLVTEAHDFNHRLLGRVYQNEGGGNSLPRSHSFLSVESHGDVVVTSIKATGNPIAGGQVPGSDDGVTIRMYEAKGRPATVRLSSPLGVSALRQLDLLEREIAQPSTADDIGLPAGGIALLAEGIALPAGDIALAAGEILTLGFQLDRTSAAAEAIPYREPVQPIFAQYWLNNTGTAPAGNVAVAVHFADNSVQAHEQFSASITVASSLNDVSVEGAVTITAPPGWTVEPPRREYILGPSAHLEFQADVRVLSATEPGCYLLAAEIEHDGQRIHDLCRVFIGGAGPEQVRAELSTTAITLAPGSSDRLTVRLGTDAASDLPAQVQLITPWDVWTLVPDWNSGALIPAKGSTEVHFDFRAPYAAPMGQWWAIVKVAAAGRVLFTSAIDVVVASQ